ncbi:D-alanyl-D-alanine carboxypeptidase (penicillin-binding protein 5/6) [Paenibacillus shirakamiensis]|uniref:serine-type D-Ala-D-Ala carboxypeptidase n=1 Tax=Paenibacillus shirakamiensis TaxID=1265935 RepID=A0ABS4JCN1_9BACL|nr:D-alanyl-D-alanine carboxypeptidase family protein [Paenibacillus shirakamiensis]MBP1999482.1 D-alanyl-D-alanine carboxypeptidase (penicillin-binding protein 5/6) [Paenibacillus shirakamiensis]
MNKKWISFALAILLTFTAMLPIGFAKGEAPAQPNANTELAPSASSAVLMDADTGTVLFEKKSHDKLPPASITKIMTMLLTVEAIDKGTIKLTDKVKASEYASSMGGSQIFLEPGEEMTVDEMLKGIAMASGNDASVAMAEKLGGSEPQFVAMMNTRAAELGMKDTHFANCNGLPTADHYSSAHDIAVMSRELLKHKQITKYTGAYQDYLRKDSAKPFWLVNTNKLVRFYTGADGLKTGYTSEAKFCLSATAKREGLRLIAVVLGEPNTKIRNSEVGNMFDFAFSQFAVKSLFKKGDVIGTVQVQKGDTQELQLAASHPYSVLVKKSSSNEKITHKLIAPATISAPVKENQLIGKLVVYQGDHVIKEYDLRATSPIEKASWWTLFKRTTSKLFFVD